MSIFALFFSFFLCGHLSMRMQYILSLTVVVVVVRYWCLLHSRSGSSIRRRPPIRAFWTNLSSTSISICSRFDWLMTLVFQSVSSVVVFRNANKIGFFIKVAPNKPSGDVAVSFVIRYDYCNMPTTLQSEAKKPDVVWLQHPVYVNLGPVQQAESFA